MNGISSIRSKFGLNQQQIAEWLGISRSLVAHYEREARSLPTSAVLQLARLEIMIAHLQKSKRTGTNKYEAHPSSTERYIHTQNALQQHARVCSYKAEIMRKELTALQIMHIQTLEWLEAIESLLSAKRNEDHDKMELLWLQAQYQQALKKLEQCDDAAQLRMQVKIASLEAIAAVHEQTQIYFANEIK